MARQPTNEMDEAKLEVGILRLVLTKDELILLAKHWAKIELDERYFYFQTGAVSNVASHIRNFPGYRLGQVASILDEVDAKKAVDEVYTAFQQDTDARLWDIFVNGDEEQWEAVQKEFYRSFDEKQERIRTKEAR